MLDIDNVIISTTINIDSEIFHMSDIKKLIIQDGAKINIDSGNVLQGNIDTMIIPQSITEDIPVQNANTIYYKTGTMGEKIAKRDAAVVAIPDDKIPEVTVSKNTTKRGV